MNNFLPWPALHLVGLSKGRYPSIQSWRILRRFVFTLPPKPSQLKEEKDHVQAAEWIKAFEAAGADAIPVDAYSITMSRSSGPGGQVGIILCQAIYLRAEQFHAPSSGRMSIN